LAADLEVPRHGKVLDYGCAEMPYRDMFGSAVQVVGADLPGNPWATVEIAPDGTLPVADESFDAVISTQVLEHVLNPTVYVEECWRVLRPGGRLLLSTHGIMVYHPDPVDLWRWTCAGLRVMVQNAGFEIVRFEGIMGLLATGLQLAQDAIYYRGGRRAQLVVATLFQSLIAAADRLESSDSRRGNALVFALVAEKPRTSR
jgi:SAM-dependent methyltransferase